MTITQLMARLQGACGRVCVVRVIPSLVVQCHPMCAHEFGVFLRDNEQRLEFESFVSLAKPRMQFLDIGAHWGLFSLAALHFGGPDARSVCIEFSAKASRTLLTNFELNDAAQRTLVINAARGDSNGELRMLTTGAHGFDYDAVPADDRPDTIVVAQVTADTVCETRGFAPTHIKIDVEGFEEEVLKGACHTLRRCKPILFLELHGDLILRRNKNPATPWNCSENSAMMNSNWRMAPWPTCQKSLLAVTMCGLLPALDKCLS